MKLLHHGLSMLLSAACMTACSSSDQASPMQSTPDASDMHVEDPGDAGDAAAPDPDAAEFVADCPESTKACSPGPLTLNTLLVAEDYGVGAKFIATNGGVVLLDLPDASLKLLRMLPDAPLEQWTVPTDLSAVHVADGPATGDCYVVGTSKASGEVALFRGTRDEPSITAIPGGTLPPATQVGGLTVDIGYASSRPCVYGPGLACFDGAAWLHLIPANIPLQGADLSGPWGLGVAQDGTMWVAARSEGDEKHTLLPFRALDAKVRGALRTINVGFERASIVTDQGVWRLSPSGQVASCTDTGTLAAVLGPAMVNEMALHSNGRYLSNHSFGVWCQVETLELGSEALGFTAAPCGPYVNPRVLTKDTLFGHNRCTDL